MSCRFLIGSFLFAEGQAYMKAKLMAISFWKRFGFLRSVFDPEQKKALAVLEVYHELDQSIEKFQAKTNLHCVVGCGHCCENPHIESTVLELLPLAHDLWQKGEAELWLDKALQPQNASQCIFYEPHPQGKGHGRCSVYPLRPLICRLFGFSAQTDKRGKPVLVTCRTIKETQADAYLKTTQQMDGGLFVPIMADYGGKIYSIDPALAQKRFPINEALRMAIERVGLQRSYQAKKL